MKSLTLLLLFDDSGPFSKLEFNWSESLDESELMKTNLKSLDSVWSSFCFDLFGEVAAGSPREEEVGEAPVSPVVFLPVVEKKMREV